MKQLEKVKTYYGSNKLIEEVMCHDCKRKQDCNPFCSALKLGRTWTVWYMSAMLMLKN
ncbi:MAG: hypothetical protein KAS32_16650 [Candidatus Peribacteraceae bacterium]|nr:hypothetical protein [Candidatus Peribacteraceae bacterium]